MNDFSKHNLTLSEKKLVLLEKLLQQEALDSPSVRF